ncbi:MAG: hypothetical protein JO147_10780 [Actinobacteria bacterium]|nr:hypothetical protein [Actinomycetota bacterium]
MLLFEARRGSVVEIRPRLRDRIWARVHADRIDHELASGASPDTDLGRALRAQRLCRSGARRELAVGIERTVAQSRCNRSSARGAGPFNRAAVSAAADELIELRDRLLADRIVSAHGLAQVRQLLTEPAGPLYRSGGSDLALVARSLIASLECADTLAV